MKNQNINSVVETAKIVGRNVVAGVNRVLPRPVRLAAVAVGVTAAGTVARAQTAFDVSTLYSGAATAFTAAATVAGGFLAIKYGAKLVKKAWAWLT